MEREPVGVVLHDGDRLVAMVFVDANCRELRPRRAGQFGGLLEGVSKHRPDWLVERGSGDASGPLEVGGTRLTDLSASIAKKEPGARFFRPFGVSSTTTRPGVAIREAFERLL